jgi:hypothetical protein
MDLTTRSLWYADELVLIPLLGSSGVRGHPVGIAGSTLRRKPAAENRYALVGSRADICTPTA